MLKPQGRLKLDARLAGYGYQIQAVEAVKKLPYAALFHEQGLGKTKIGLDLALEWLRTNEIDSILIVTKRSLVENWQYEIKAHTYLSVRTLAQNRSSNFFALNSPVRIYLTHYEVVKTEERRLALFLRTRRVAAILDESHKIKNPDSEIAKALHRLAEGFTHRVIMTGTPVANRPYDLWSQIYFLDKGEALGRNFVEFRRRLDLTNDLAADSGKRTEFENELSEVFCKIQRFTVREIKDSAGIQLPEKQIQNILVTLEGRQRTLYDQFRNELGAAVLRGGQLVMDDAEEVLKRLLRLVQLASNPALVDQSYDGVPGKYPALEALITRAIGEGSKIIVWTSFVDNARWLKKCLDRFGTVTVHGSLPFSDRSAAIGAFKKDADIRILVATPGAAKEGLTLTVANHAIFYDRSFSLDDYLQAQDRIHRISQTQTCYVWNLLSRDTVDEWVDLLLAAKRLAAQLAQSDISPDQYKQLASYDFGKIVREILGRGKGKMTKLEAAASVLGTIRIRGQDVPTQTRDIEQRKLQFYVDNPRIYSLVRTDGHIPDQDEIWRQLLELEHVRILKEDIVANDGLIDPLIVREGDLVVLEGNSRLAAYRFLASKEPLRWGKVRCTVLPADIDEKLVFALLGQYHVKGKKDWAPYEKAGFLYRRYKEHGLKLSNVADELGIGYGEAKHLVGVYEFMIKHDDTHRDRWSYYDEYLKSTKIKNVRDEHANFDNLIVNEIKGGRIPKAMELRDKLPTICAGPPKVLKRYMEGRLPFDDAYESAVDAGGENYALKKLRRFRDWFALSDTEDDLLEANKTVRDKMLFEVKEIEKRSKKLKDLLEKNKSKLN